MPRFNKLIEVQAPVYEASKNAMKEKVQSGWERVALVWGSIVGQASNIAIIADAKSFVISHTITIRYRSDVNSTCRFVHNGIVYRIVSLVPSEDNIYLEANCQQLVGQTE